MLHTFVSSPAARVGSARIGVASFSLIAHAGLITLAAVSSGRSAPTGTAFDAVPAERLNFVNVREATRPDVAERTKALARAAMKAARRLVPDLAKLRIAVDASLADLPAVPSTAVDVDLTSRAGDARDFGDIDTSELLGSSTLWALSHPGPNGAYSEEIVERIAWPARDNPRPRYPETLRNAGVEGTFMVEFVVDSTGRVDAKTLTFRDAVHPLFLRAVKDALLRSRYFPAELAGTHVRQLVQQRFTFVLGR
jgi:TonB family protein